jgi:hypothetical protein
MTVLRQFKKASETASDLKKVTKRFFKRFEFKILMRIPA